MGGLSNYDHYSSNSYAQKGKDEVITPLTGGALVLGEATLENNSGGAIDVFIGYKHVNSMWKAGQWVNATTTFTDDTTDAQSAATGDFPVTTTTNNDGFIIGSNLKFNLIGMTVSQAQAGAPVYAYEYWNGSAWTVIPAGAIKETPASFTVADQFIVFQAPHDWAKGGSGTGVDQTRYNIRMRATTAPSTAVIASVLWIGTSIAMKESLANNTKFSIDQVNTELVLPGGCGLLPYFGGTASAANMVEARYRTIGSVPS